VYLRQQKTREKFFFFGFYFCLGRNPSWWLGMRDRETGEVSTQAVKKNKIKITGMSDSFLLLFHGVLSFTFSSSFLFEQPTSWVRTVK
jgi:hypothetical protein